MVRSQQERSASRTRASAMRFLWRPMEERPSCFDRSHGKPEADGRDQSGARPEEAFP